MRLQKIGLNLQLANSPLDGGINEKNNQEKTKLFDLFGVIVLSFCF
jgi:hypothetical protein